MLELIAALVAALQATLGRLGGVPTETPRSAPSKPPSEPVSLPQHGPVPLPSDLMVNTDLITKWEALRLRAYLPTPHDVPTIGWGHTRGVKMGDEISMAKAKEFLQEDLSWVRDTVRDLVKVPLTAKQRDALYSLIFNIGRTNFANSTVLRRLNARDYTGAAAAFAMWNKQRQNGKLVVLKGLTRRRAEETAYFLEGTSK